MAARSARSVNNRLSITIGHPDWKVHAFCKASSAPYLSRPPVIGVDPLRENQLLQ